MAENASRIAMRYRENYSPRCHVDCWNCILFNKGKDGNDEYSNYFGWEKKSLSIWAPNDEKKKNHHILHIILWLTYMESYEVKYEWTMGFTWVYMPTK